MIGIRAALNIAIFISILFFPWWISLALGILLIAVCKSYEVLVWGLFFDALYGTPLDSLFGIEYVASVLFLFLFLVSFLVKKRVIFYKST